MAGRWQEQPGPAVSGRQRGRPASGDGLHQGALSIDVYANAYREGTVYARQGAIFPSHTFYLHWFYICTRVPSCFGHIPCSITGHSTTTRTPSSGILVPTPNPDRWVKCYSMFGENKTLSSRNLGYSVIRSAASFTADSTAQPTQSATFVGFAALRCLADTPGWRQRQDQRRQLRCGTQPSGEYYIYRCQLRCWTQPSGEY